MIRMSEHLARHVDWTPYYEEAEAGVDWQWSLISKYKEPLSPDLSLVLDFACGRGRIAQKFAEIATKLICVDIRQQAIDYCLQRFASRKNTQCLVSGESSIPVASDSVTFLYSWDSMVHFHQGELAVYFKEFHRVMAPGATGLIHHSNYGALTKDARPWNENPGWRAHVSAPDVHDICTRAGLTIVNQTVIDWSQPSLDCVTTFRKAPRS
jgi:SAM-dependent methyltransferase